jgi:multiple antibiotic resistance protein
MIAGPGSIATVMLLMARAHGSEESAIVLAALGLNLALMLLALLAVAPIMRLFGNQVEAVITRLLGVILAALAVQFVLDGLQGSIL